ncbi:hypothetical protein ACFWR9_39250 [Streptomyces sp. NPDC058534]|uniref:hypothetical protein n=1 Tax=Streptomyces sp. NPDC058534 TaxID=3346541 RepID=UPI00364B0439
MTPLAATMLLVDKWETKQLCGRAGLDVPDGFRVDSDGHPHLRSPADLDAHLTPRPGTVSTVVEQVIEGDLCSVDIVGRPGSYRVLPLCWTGRAGAEPVFTFADLRWCGPREEADTAFAEVARTLTGLCGSLGVHGSVNVDMIYTGGRFVSWRSIRASAAPPPSRAPRPAPTPSPPSLAWPAAFPSPEVWRDGPAGRSSSSPTTALRLRHWPNALTELYEASGFPATEVMARIGALLDPNR